MGFLWAGTDEYLQLLSSFIASMAPWLHPRLPIADPAPHSHPSGIALCPYLPGIGRVRHVVMAQHLVTKLSLVGGMGWGRHCSISLLSASPLCTHSLGPPVMPGLLTLSLR